MDHLKAIDGLLIFHRGEIERLEVARKVLLEIDRRNGDAREGAKDKRQAAPKKLTSQKKANGDVSARGQISERIRKALENGAATSDELATAFGLPRTNEARKPLQNALYNMRVTGALHRDPKKRYSLTAAA